MQKIKDVFNGRNSVKSATIILVVTLFLSNVLGVIRDHFLAQKIPTDMLDTYYAAFRIPDLVFNILILGSITAAFIPIFTSFIAKKNIDEAWKITNSFLNIVFIILSICLIILFFLMPFFVPLLVPKFDLIRQETTIKLARLFLLSPLFFSVSYILGGILNSFKRFLAYSLAPLIYNVSIIVAALFFADKYGVFGVAFGVVIGASMHMLIQLPIAIKLGFRYRPIADWKNPTVRRIGYLMIPRAVGLGSMQIMLMVYTALASAVSAGSVAILNLADNIQTMPTVVFATSLATAIFPTLSERYAMGQQNDFANYIWRGIRTIAFILIPASMAIILLRAQIVRIILGSGHFGWEQTISTANTLGFFAISLFAQGLIPLFARAFYAIKNTKKPTIISVISIIVSIVFGLLFVGKLQVQGLALAFSIGSFVNALLLYIYLRKDMPKFLENEKKFLVFLMKIIFSTIIMAIIIQLAKNLIEPFVDMQRTWGVITQFSIAGIAGFGVYSLFSWVLKCEEFDEIKTILLNKFKIQ